ncbi:MAG: hypothetical protein NT151_04405 [Acidobacteria bacterium]|nr:hypothetical protein [Acidobacteriota bacterium]
MLGFLTWAQASGSRLRNRLRDQDGQTSSEYLVIAGIVVTIIIAIMVVFREQLMTAIGNLTGNIVKSTQ